MHPASVPQVDRTDPVGEEDHHRGRRQHEGDRRHEAAGHAGTPHPEREGNLAARGAGQELAQGDEVRIGCVVQPAAPLNDFPAEISEMGNRASKRRQAELEESRPYLGQSREAVQRITSRDKP
jgi:hypothetical protein